MKRLTNVTMMSVLFVISAAALVLVLSLGFHRQQTDRLHGDCQFRKFVLSDSAFQNALADVDPNPSAAAVRRSFAREWLSYANNINGCP